MRNLPKPVLGFDLRKVDNLCGEIFRDFPFVKLTRNDLAQLSWNNTWMRIFFARDVYTEDIKIPNADVIGFLKVEL